MNYQENDLFLDELESRLEENRKLAKGTMWPKPLQGLVSYFGFHSFRSLFLISLGLTIGLFWLWYWPLISLSKNLFWL